MSSAETEAHETPSSLHAARFANTAFFFAACVVVLFPTVVGAGTASQTERYVVGGFVGVCALLASLLRRHGRPALAGPLLLALGAWPLGAPWLSTFGVIGFAYVAWGLRRDATTLTLEPNEEEQADAVRDNVEAIAMALVIALLFKTFIAEAFVIPTGSMEPTIYGSQRGKRAGDRILAVKPPLLFGDPPRWSIMVFKFPLFRPTNYIKRLVGMPGERLEIRDGDVYADGELLSKPDAVQETLWQPLFPDPDARPELATDLARYWRVEGDGRIEGAGHADGGFIAFDGKTEIVWDQQLRQSDFKLEADFDFEDPSAAEVTFRIGGRRSGLPVLRPQLTFTGEGARLTGPVEEHWDHAIDSTRLGFSVADRIARVYVDGRQIARVDFSATTLEAAGDEQRISIGISGSGGTVTDLRLSHDIHYTGTHTFDIPDDGFVMLGDNTSNSSDSRKWSSNVVTLADGTQYVAPDRVHTESDGEVRNFVTDDDAGVFRFRDSYGVPREVPMDEADVEVRRLPIVRRHDLVGRAFFIFFPFPPFQDEFRPRFLP